MCVWVRGGGGGWWGGAWVGGETNIFASVNFAQRVVKGNDDLTKITRLQKFRYK